MYQLNKFKYGITSFVTVVWFKDAAFAFPQSFIGNESHSKCENGFQKVVGYFEN